MYRGSHAIKITSWIQLRVENSLVHGVWTFSKSHTYTRTFQ